MSQLKTQVMVGVALLVSACGGNWSNRDLDFINALPDTTALKSNLPERSTSSSPLSGVQTRRDGLSVGDPSQAYSDARKAKTDFNGMLDSILGTVELLRQYPPTTRTDASRIWGPYPDSQNAGFEFRLTITLVTDSTAGTSSFAWALESHKVGNDFFPVVTGAFKPTMSLKQGQGSMIVHVKDFKDQLKVDDGLRALDQIDISYTTDAFPNAVGMLFTFAAGNTSGLSQIGYLSKELADGSGALAFALATPSNPAVTVMQSAAVWRPSGAGRSQGLVTEGTAKGASQVECWDDTFHVTYFAQGWPGGMVSGNESDCVTVSGF